MKVLPLLQLSLYGLLTIALSGSLSGCFGSSDSSESDSHATSGAPSDITYSKTSAVYSIRTPIEANSPTVYGSAAESFEISPTLPSGLQFSSTTGQITGTPYAVSSATQYQITARNGYGSGVARITIQVTDQKPKMTISPSEYSFTVGTKITAVTPLLGGGETERCLIEPALPAGLELSSLCEISGTPTVAKVEKKYTLTAQNSGGDSTAKIQITVVDLPPVISFSYSFVLSRSLNVPKRYITNTGGEILSCSISPALPTGLSMDDNCSISGTPTALSSLQTYTITANNSGGTATTTINLSVVEERPQISYATTSFTYTKGTEITELNPINVGGPITDCAKSANLPSGLSLSATCRLTGTPTSTQSATSYTITASNDGGSSAAVISIAVSDIAPQISFPSSPYSFVKLTAISSISVTNSKGSITSCSVSPSLPTGLSLDGTTCAITGTPSVVSSATTYTVTASNSIGSSQATLSIAITEAAPVLSFTGSPYTFNKSTAVTTVTPTNTGGTPTSCTASPALPAGLSLSSACVITGTPTATVAIATYTISSSNSGGSDSDDISITVYDQLPVISYAGSPYTYVKNTAITALVPSNSGGTATSCAVNTPLPTGLTLSSTCEVTGTPTVNTSGVTNTYTITPTNAGGSGSAVSIQIRVNDPAPNLTFSGSPYTFTQNSIITTKTPANTGGSVSSCTSSPTLPAGLSLSSACEISGTPTAYSSMTSYTLTATNATSNTQDVVIGIIVNAETPAITYALSSYSYTVSSAITTLTPTNSGGTIGGCSITPTLPSGLTLSSACVISGTPTLPSVSQLYTITATSSDSNTSSATTVTFEVLAVAPSISYAGSPLTYTKSSAIATLTPTNTGGTVTSCSILDEDGAGLPAGLSLSPTCVISGTPSTIKAQKTYTVSAVNTGGTATTSLVITVVDISPTLSYGAASYTYSVGDTVSISATRGGGDIVSCSVIDSVTLATKALPTGWSISSTSGSQCDLSGTATAVAASGTYRIKATNSNTSVTVDLTFVVNDIVPALSYSSTPFTFIQNSAITAQTPVHTGGTAVSCSSNPALPAGLSLSATCVLSGTPTVTSGATAYVISATNTGGTGTANITITVNAVTPVFSYASSSVDLTSYLVNASAYSLSPTFSSGAVSSCSSSAVLPTGLSLSAGCVISGTPTVAAAAVTYTITATNSTGQTGITTITFGFSPYIDYTPTSYSYTYTKSTAITALAANHSGGTATSCAVSPALPAGLSLSSICDLSGTPTVVSAISSYAITATNSTGSYSVNISITVVDVTPSISYASTPFVFDLRTAITSQTVVNSGGTITSCTSSPTLPSGLSLSSTCTISGTPTAVQSATTYTITATNTGGSATTTVSIRVLALPQIVFSSLMATSGSANGTATSSRNIWLVSTDAAGKTILTSNTNSSLSSIAPAFSEAGSSIASLSLRALSAVNNGTTSNSYNIWTMTSAGASAAARTTNSITGLDATGHVAWSPDGTKLAYASKQNVLGTTNGAAASSYNIWIMSADGTSKIALTANTNAGLDSYWPVFSPDGTKIYFYSKTATSAADNGTATASYNLWKVAIDGTSRTAITTDDTAGIDSTEPAISPDGTTLVYTYTNTAGGVLSTNIYKISTAGAGKTALTSETLVSRDSKQPRYSYDGTEIVFASKMQVSAVDANSFNIWKMTSAGASQTALTTNTNASLDSVNPHFSTDDSKIAFESLQNVSGTVNGAAASSYNIWKMSDSGTSAVALTTNTNAGLDSYLSTSCRGVWYIEN